MASDHLIDSVIQNNQCCQTLPSEEPVRLARACCLGYTTSFLALSQLSPPEEGACKHHDTFVIIQSLHSLLGEREEEGKYLSVALSSVKKI